MERILWNLKSYCHEVRLRHVYSCEEAIILIKMPLQGDSPLLMHLLPLLFGVFRRATPNFQ